METMHPVVLHGRTGGSAAALPREEFAERIQALQAAAADAGLAGVAVYGDARDHAALCYVSGFIPMLRWAAALVPTAGEPSLYVAAPSRDMTFTRALSWFDDVCSATELDEALSGLARRGTVALVGAQRARASVRRRLAGAAELTDAEDSLLTGRMWTPRRRELFMLRDAQALTRRAADLAEARYDDGAGATEALLAAARLARDQGAHDVRALYSPDGGLTLRPFETVVNGRPRPFVFYLALELDGYWGETFRTLEADSAAQGTVEEVLRSVARELHPGLRAGDILARLGRRSGGGELHPVVSGRRAIARLGLGRDDRFAAEAGALLAPGVYSLRAGEISDGTGVLLSTVVEVGLGEADG